MEPIIIVHGGAGDITDSRVPGKHKGVKESVIVGYTILRNEALPWMLLRKL